MSSSSQESLDVLPFMRHFSELRKRLLWALVSVLGAFFVCFSYSSELIHFLGLPLREVLGEDYLPGFKEVVEPFMVSLRVSFLSAVILSAPLWFYQFWKFLEPALYMKEKYGTLISCVFSWLLFWLGALFCFFLILPWTLDFLMNWGKDFAHVDLTIHSYTSFLTLLLLGFGVIFQLPLILIWCSFMGLVEAKHLKKARRYVILACFVVSAVLTPPDWISQVGMAVPIYILYEIALCMVWLLEKRRTAKEEA